jgi:hypothetical protein
MHAPVDITRIRSMVKLIPMPEKAGPIIRLDRERLEHLTGLTISWTDMQEFVELITIWVGRRRDLQHYRGAELLMRRAFVRAVYHTWVDCRAQGGGAYLDSKYTAKGPLIRLLTELFRAAGEEPPSAITLYWDLVFVWSGEERSR